jgi:hypothetical protein
LKHGEEKSIKERLRESAIYLREVLLKKPIPLKPFPIFQNNVAIAEVHIGDVYFCVGTTSNKTTLIPIPTPKSTGGQFQPQFDSFSKRLMDTCSEYKVLSKIANTLEIQYNLEVEGYLYLYTERSPCESCQDIIKQFKEKFTNIKIEIFSDYPYPK